MGAARKLQFEESGTPELQQRLGEPAHLAMFAADSTMREVLGATPRDDIRDRTLTAARGVLDRDSIGHHRNGDEHCLRLRTLVWTLRRNVAAPRPFVGAGNRDGRRQLGGNRFSTAGGCWAIVPTRAAQCGEMALADCRLYVAGCRCRLPFGLLSTGGSAPRWAIHGWPRFLWLGSRNPARLPTKIRCRPGHRPAAYPTGAAEADR